MDNILAGSPAIRRQKILLFECQTLLFQRIVTINHILDEMFDIRYPLPLIMQIKCVFGVRNHIVLMVVISD